MSTTQAEIKLDNFEGPLDLLLHLVSAYKVDIFEVPLVLVIEQYLAYLNALKEFDLEVAGDYMLMASQLMLIKSRKLLPTEDEDFVEETESLEQDLLSQIEEYRQFKLISTELNQLHEERARYFSKPKTEIVAAGKPELRRDISTIDLFLVFSQILRNKQKSFSDQHAVVVSEHFSIEEKIAEIRERIENEWRLSFSEIFEDQQELITSFLAILELVKQ